MGAVTNDRQRLVGQRGEDQLTMLAIAQHCCLVERVDDLRAEVVLPDVRTVLGLHRLTGHPWPHDLRNTVDVAGVDIARHLDLAAHLLGPGLGSENGVF